MIVNFFLPGIPKDPVGGYKVIYQYANALSQKNHQVNIIHVDNIDVSQYSKKTGSKLFHKRITIKKIINKLRLFTKKFKLNAGLLKGQKAVKWFNLEDNIKVTNLWEFSLDDITIADVNIATAWNTAILLNNIPEDFGEKFYFIQGYENWQDTVAVDATFGFKMHKIVIAKWLQDMLKSDFDEDSVIVPNFIDFNDYYITNEIELRNNKTLTMLYHESPTKGIKYGLKAIQTIKDKYPNINVNMFGVYNRPKNLPNYIKYYKKPNIDQIREQIYNKSSIFISPSIQEGWGLTVSEAMACGSAIVASDSKGINDFCKNNINSLIVAPKSSDELVKSIEYLLTNNEKRIELSENGYRTILKFSLDRSVELLEKILKKD